MANNRITESEWLDELARLSRKNDTGLTTSEWMAKLGRGKEAVLKVLSKAKALGWLQHGKRTVTALDGRSYAANVYSVVRPKKK